METYDPIQVYDETVAGLRRRIPDGFWADPGAARLVLEEVLRRQGFTLDDAPRILTMKWLRRHRFRTLLATHRDSPFLILQSLYPSRFRLADFSKSPQAEDILLGAMGGAGLAWSPIPSRRWFEIRKYRARTTGTCIKCKQPRRAGSSYCHHHSQALTRTLRDRARRLRAAGLCPRCGRNQILRSGTCNNCYERQLIGRRLRKGVSRPRVVLASSLNT